MPGHKFAVRSPGTQGHVDRTSEHARDQEKINNP